MAITHVASSNTTYANRSNTSVTKPTGTSDDDLIVLFFLNARSGSYGPAPTAPSGFTALGSMPVQVGPSGNFYLQSWVYYKVASGEGASWTFTHAAISTQALSVVYRGVDTTTPLDVTSTINTSTTSTTRTWTGLTTATAEAMLVALGQDWGDTANNLTPPTGFTERIEVNPLVYAADKIQTSAGATGNFSHTCNSASGEPRTGVLVALRPASGGSPQTVTPTGIASSEAIGTPAAQTTVTTSPAAVPSGEALGTPTVQTSVTISPSGIAGAEALGTPAVQTTVTVSPTGISSTTATGTPTVQAAVSVSPTGIASTSATGTPQVTATVTVTPSGISTGAAVGTPSIVLGGAVSPTGIPSGEQLGTPTVSTTITTSPGGVATSTATGNPAITTSLTVAPSGISSGAALGTPVVTGGASSVARTMPLTLTLVAPQRNLAISPIPVRDLEVVAPERKVDLITPVRHLEINMTDTVKYGDTHSISMTITDGANVVVDLTGTTIRLLAKSGDAATVELDATLDADPTTGVVHHVLTGTLPVGTYDVEAEDTLGVVKTTSPTVGYAKLIVAQDLG